MFCDCQDCHISYMAALEKQDLFCAYLAHHELESVLIMYFIVVTQVKSPKAFNSRIYSLIKDAMDLKGDLTVSPQDDSIEVTLPWHLGCCLSGFGLMELSIFFVMVALHAV